MMAYASNFSTQETEAGGLLWFETSLSYILNSRQALTTKRDFVNPVLQRKKKTRRKKKRKWQTRIKYLIDDIYQEQISLSHTSDGLALTLAVYPFQIDNHFLFSKRIDFASEHAILFPKSIRLQPIFSTQIVFVDAEKMVGCPGF